MDTVARSPAPRTPDQSALLETFAVLLKPLAALALARGLPYAAVEELMRTAFVEAARESHSDWPAHGLVSRISTATGLSRREVTRLVQPDAEPVSPRRWPAGEVFTRWLGDPALRPEPGERRRLRRHGAAPSFEALAQSVTRDVHPRSLLDELCRLGLAIYDETDDSVELQRDAFVPKGDFARMLGFLGDNVGDHLSAAVANVGSDGSRHLEQAVFADELSSESLESMRRIVTEQWQAMFDRLVPAFEQAIADDRAAGRTQDRRMRVGLYTYTAPMTGAAAPDESNAAADAAAPAATARPPIRMSRKPRSGAAR